MNKAIFLDRDGTVIKDKGYAFDPCSIEFIEGAVSSLLRLQNAGYLLIIITNQSGVAKGLFTEEQLKDFNKEMLSLLEKRGVHISAVYYCPHHPKGTVIGYARECLCRKPGTQLFLDAAKSFDVDFGESYAIGDRERDCSICLDTECRGFVLGTGEAPTCQRIMRAKTLERCVDYILGDVK